MKRIKLCFAIIVVMFLIKGLAFAQDTTLTVTSAGNVGIGTNNPAFLLDVFGTNYKVRYNSGGNVDVLINRASNSNYGNLQYASDNTLLWAIGLRGVSAADGLFFHDEDAGTTRMMIDGTSGNVGIGTTSPGAKLHLGNGSAGFTPFTSTGLAVESSGTTRIQLMSPTTSAGQILFGSPTEADRGFITYDHVNDGLLLGSGGGTKMIIDDNGNVSIGAGGTPNFPLEMGSGAHVTAGGVWTDASSRQYKENIANLTQEEAISALEKLNPVKFNYKVQKGEEYIGFIAEDVPDLVATGDRKSLSPMDIVAVLTKVVQQQQKKIAELEARLNASQ